MAVPMPELAVVFEMTAIELTYLFAGSSRPWRTWPTAPSHLPSAAW
jgi:hypothetical protein